MGVADGNRVIAAGGVEAANGSVAGGDGLTSGDSNGSGEGMGPFFSGFRTVKEGGGMELRGGVVGGLMVRGCFGDEGVD